MSDGVAVVDLDGRVLFGNQGLARLLGLERLEWDDVRLPMPEGDTGVMSLEGAGGPREVEIATERIVWDGVDAHVAVVRDLTARRQIEARAQAVQRAEALGQLAGGVAHEMNNLLALVLANVALILDGPIPGDVRRLVEEIGLGAQRGGALVKRLLAFGRRHRMKLETLDLGETVRGLEEPLRRILPGNVRLEVENPGQPCFVMADRDAIEQILVNLALNARDAMSDGGVIHIGVERVDVGEASAAELPGLTAGPLVRLSVRDDGHGMDDAELDSAFEPFFTTKGLHNNSGMGLPTVFGLTKQLDGWVYMSSVLGEGTVVDLFFNPVPELVRVAQEAPAPTLHLGGTETILLVEDERPVRDATARLLRRFGYGVIDAADGEEALRLLRTGSDKIDLVVSDVVMPNLGGRGLLEAMRALPAPPPIMFVSGYSSEDLKDGQQLDDTVRLVGKPWSIDELLSGVRAALAEAPPKVADVRIPAADRG